MCVKPYTLHLSARGNFVRIINEPGVLLPSLMEPTAKSCRTHETVLQMLQTIRTFHQDSFRFIHTNNPDAPGHIGKDAADETYHLCSLDEQIVFVWAQGMKAREKRDSRYTDHSYRKGFKYPVNCVIQ